MKRPMRPLRVSATSPDERAVVALLELLPDPSPDRRFIEHIWQGLHGRHPRASQTWRWATASGVAFALGLATLWLARSPPRAEMLLVEGAVFRGATGRSWSPALSGEPLRTGALVESDASGRSLVRLPGIAAVLAEPNTNLELEGLGNATQLRLTGGAVTLRVTKRPSGHPFAVRVGDYTVTVVGTLFTVADLSNGHVEVSVDEGAVRVSGMGGEWRVSAGQLWNSETPGQRAVRSEAASSGPLLEAAVEKPNDAQLGELFRALGRRRTSEPSLAATPAAEVPTPPSERPAASHAPVHTPVLLPPRVVPAMPAQETATRHPHPSVAPPRLAVAEPAPPTALPAASPPIVLVPVSPPETAVPAPASPVVEQDLYAEALSLERRGDHRRAASMLETALASGRGPRDLELYQLALLRERHLDDPKGALDALLSYRTGFPRGGLRQEVDLSVIESRLALGQTDTALSESAAFLARYPRSERVDEMRFMRGDLLRRRGDCAGALAEYRAVSRGPVLDDASYFSAFCQRELGAPDAAARAFREYLARFPSGKHIRAAHEALGE
jgi:ferric-dicitrate binding protein FerR (iron transport regulator)/TolA-binding protein